MSWGQFFLGVVTIFVATFVYRWQKMIDRETTLQSEQRKLFSDYLGLSKVLFLNQPYKDQYYSREQLDEFFSISDKEIQLYSLRDQILMHTSSGQLLDALTAHDEAFRNWKISFPKHDEIDEATAASSNAAADELQQAHYRLLEEFRTELEKHRSTSPRDVFRALLGN